MLSGLAPWVSGGFSVVAVGLTVFLTLLRGRRSGWQPTIPIFCFTEV